CRERAGGHPHFVEELVKELFDSGALRVVNGSVVDLDLERGIGVPRSLKALVASRAARLPLPERQMLQAAAILGDPADLAVLAIMLRVPLAGLERTASALEGRGIVRRVGGGTIAFASPLWAEVLARALPIDAKKQMHAAAAAAFEEALGDRVFD